MTRRSRREIEQKLDDLAPSEGADRRPVAVVYEDAETGEWWTSDGRTVPKAAAPLMVIKHSGRGAE